MRQIGCLLFLVLALALGGAGYLYLNGPALLAPTHGVAMAPPANPAQLFQQRTVTAAHALVAGKPASVLLTADEVNQLLGLTTAYQPGPGAPLRRARVGLEAGALVWDCVVVPEPGALPAGWRHQEIGLQIRFSAAEEGGRLVLRPTALRVGRLDVPMALAWWALDHVQPGGNPLSLLEDRFAAARAAGVPVSLQAGGRAVRLDYTGIQFGPLPVRVTGARLEAGGLLLTLART